MAFRRRPMGRRRFRRRWDMQTFRDCEREFLVPTLNEAASCGAPLIFADYLCGIGPSTSPQMKSGASRALTFGGGHLRIRYNAAVLREPLAPCRGTMKVVTALVVLPLLENDLTPAYLPNLAVARSQLSIVPATESDTDENILFWRDCQLDLINIACTGCDGDEDPCDIGCDDADGNMPLGITLPAAAALWGRDDYEFHVKAKRRLREREALFLVTEIVASWSCQNDDVPWPIHRNAYFRYAVR